MGSRTTRLLTPTPLEVSDEQIADAECRPTTSPTRRCPRLLLDPYAYEPDEWQAASRLCCTFEGAP